jgi:hypothetical protein
MTKTMCDRCKAEIETGAMSYARTQSVDVAYPEGAQTIMTVPVQMTITPESRPDLCRKCFAIIAAQFAAALLAESAR